MMDMLLSTDMRENSLMGEIVSITIQLNGLRQPRTHTAHGKL